MKEKEKRRKGVMGGIARGRKGRWEGGRERYWLRRATKSSESRLHNQKGLEPLAGSSRLPT